MNTPIVRFLAMLAFLTAAIPLLAGWSIHTPADDTTYVYPESELSAAGDGPEAEQFGLYLKQDGSPYDNWPESTDNEGVWDKTPLSDPALPVGEYLMYIKFEGGTPASVGFEIVPDQM